MTPGGNAGSVEASEGGRGGRAKVGVGGMIPGGRGGSPGGSGGRPAGRPGGSGGRPGGRGTFTFDSERPSMPRLGGTTSMLCFGITELKFAIC